MYEKPLKLNIEPYFDQDNPQSCDDNIMISVANWKKRDFELMYADQWKFDFSMKKTDGIFDKTDLAARLYYMNSLKTFKLYSEVTGITISRMEDTNIIKISEKLRKSEPVAIKLDTYYLPWHENLYERIHSEHSCLIVGYDPEGFYINDTTMRQKPVKKAYISYETVKTCSYDEAVFFSVEKTANEVNSQISIQNINEESFAKMEKYRKYVKEEGYTKEDLEPFDGGEGIVLRAIRNIIRSRKNYLLAVNCYCSKEGKDCEEFAKLITKANNKWELQKILLQKAFF